MSYESKAKRRKIVNNIMFGLCIISAVLALIPLGLIFFYTVKQGIGAINIDFFTNLPKPVGETGGGMSNAIVGTLTLIGLASCMGLPIGILSGIYLSEYGGNKFAQAVRFLTEVLNGLPSIIIGIFAYTVIVMPMKRFSALAGGFALGILMIPVITKTTEEMLKLVPQTYREAGLGLGISQWVVTLRIIFPAAAKGIITGIMLSIARVSGETAPLLFTALNNRFWHTTLDQPIASLPVQIFSYAIAPFDDWHQQAWAGALVLITLIFVLSVVVRWVTGGKFTIQQ